eukprot:CAMPEP_0170205164 /NCGR_PEP_ID=MMETSP0116_2-20130129/2120_1 /TAXON_ID=400756 /ORGANISM="Durinskia baltica, Strain CSIRO CS-38" /LENGTH=130 /DNA_ID=CAMNT_0010455543 /DNA_START=630 /DNA_END=1018 /DNA_ORIENTATION=-
MNEGSVGLVKGSVRSFPSNCRWLICGKALGGTIPLIPELMSSNRSELAESVNTLLVTQIPEFNDGRVGVFTIPVTTYAVGDLCKNPSSRILPEYDVRNGVWVKIARRKLSWSTIPAPVSAFPAFKKSSAT